MRTKEQINTEYSAVAGELGNLQYHYEVQKAKYLNHIQQLEAEMAAILAEEAKAENKDEGK